MKIALTIIVVMNMVLCAAHSTQSRPTRAVGEFTSERVLDYHMGTLASNTYYITHQFERAFLEGAETVLDIGCGSGSITSLLAKMNPLCTFIGCDISHDMITFARQTYPEYEYPNLKFTHKDARTLELEESVDRIVSFNCLNCVDDPKSVVKSMYTCLKGGGKAFIVVTPKSMPNDFEAACRSVIISTRWLTSFLSFKMPYSLLSVDQYKKLFAHAGFTLEDVQVREVSLQFKSRAEAEVLLRATLLPLHHLAEPKRAVFMDDIFAAFARQGVIDKDGSVTLRVTQVYITVAKPLL